MLLLPSLTTLFLFSCPAAAEYLSDLSRIGSAKAVSADLLEGLTNGAGKEYAMMSNVVYNDKRVNTEIPLGDVTCNITMYSADSNLVLDTVGRIAKVHGYVYQVTCRETTDRRQNMPGVRCKVALQPSSFTKLTFKTIEACNEAMSINSNHSKHSTNCTKIEGNARKGQLHCVFDYEPSSPADAPLSADIVKKVYALMREVPKNTHYREHTQCYHNGETKVVNHLSAGQIHCEIVFKHLPPQPMCTFLGYLFSRC